MEDARRAGGALAGGSLSTSTCLHLRARLARRDICRLVEGSLDNWIEGTLATRLLWQTESFDLEYVTGRGIAFTAQSLVFA